MKDYKDTIKQLHDNYIQITDSLEGAAEMYEVSGLAGLIASIVSGIYELPFEQVKQDIYYFNQQK